LPGAEGIAVHLDGKVDYVLIDRQNYHYADWVYRKYSLNDAMYTKFFNQMKIDLSEAFRKRGITYKFLF
ncbi:radical SAM protein, partial [Candidatus Bathyarchaeota archaeon]|nr:radical SAM protein [Candidatus Bathyarchaeota archaeon]